MVFSHSNGPTARFFFLSHSMGEGRGEGARRRGMPKSCAGEPRPLIPGPSPEDGRREEDQPLIPGPLG
jgi:hypothetical protein